MPRLIRDGRMVRPALASPAAAPRSTALGLPKGVPLVRIQRGGLAAKAGLKAFARGDGGVVQGDVITAINDEAIDDADDMLNALEKLQPRRQRDADAVAPARRARSRWCLRIGE